MMCLTQYIQILAFQHAIHIQIIKETFYILFLQFWVLEFQRVLSTRSTSHFTRATCWVLRTHVWVPGGHRTEQGESSTVQQNFTPWCWCSVSPLPHTETNSHGWLLSMWHVAGAAKELSFKCYLGVCVSHPSQVCLFATHGLYNLPGFFLHGIQARMLE